VSSSGGFDILHLPMLTLAVFCAHAGLMIAAVLVAGRKPIQRAGAGLFLAGCFFLEWFAPVDMTSRAVLAFGGLAALVGTITVAASATPQWSARLRLLQMLTAGYRIRAGHTRPVLSVRIIGRLIVEVLVMGAACLWLRHIIHAQLLVAVSAPGRLVAGIILFYAGMEALKDLVHFCFLASGAAMRPLHVTPVAARSLRDFWGKRWNRAVNAWFCRFIFLPLARWHHPTLGLVCVFLFSAAGHAWVALVALGASAALSVGAFFCLQAVFILTEDRLHVCAWPIPLARVWTLAILLLTLPLFIYPYLSLIHL
jgi:hypothetical protein